MNPPEIIHYFNENYLYFYKTKEKQFIKQKLENQINSSMKIINSDNYINELAKIIKTNKLTNLIWNNIKIIIPANYTKTEQIIINNIFESLGFTQIKQLRELEIIKLVKKSAFIKLNNNNLYIYYLKNNKTDYIFIDFNQFIKIDNNKIVKMITNVLKELKIEKIYFFGENQNIKKISENIENYIKKKSYVFSNKYTYLIEEALKN